MAPDLPLPLSPAAGKDNHALGRATTVDLLQPGALDHSLMARLRAGPVILALPYALLARKDVSP